MIPNVLSSYLQMIWYPSDKRLGIQAMTVAMDFKKVSSCP